MPHVFFKKNWLYNFITSYIAQKKKKKLCYHLPFINDFKIFANFFNFKNFRLSLNK